ncbi:hypothetical protein ABI59_14630 [Acidobacteria bacterium Mor1]|nr:hypothetical protein ABI59_14630 [Acidobacteria bacterium Mor1]
MSEEPLLQPEEVASVLGGDEEGSPDPSLGGGEPSMATRFSLRQPLTLTPAEEQGARQRAEKLVQSMQKALCQELDGEYEIQIEGFQQERAESALTLVPEPAWSLPMHLDSSGGMLLVLNPSLALALVEMAMGGVGNPPENGRGPTPLEVRVAERLIAGLSSRISKASDYNFSKGSVAVGKIPSAIAAPGEIVGVALLRFKLSEEAERTSVLLLTTNMLRAPKEAAGAEQALGPMSGRVQELPVETRPVLPAGQVTLKELTSLKPGSILKLDRNADSELDLRVAGETLFRGNLTRGEKELSFTVDWRRDWTPEEKPQPPKEKAQAAKQPGKGGQGGPRAAGQAGGQAGGQGRGQARGQGNGKPGGARRNGAGAGQDPASKQQSEAAVAGGKS